MSQVLDRPPGEARRAQMEATLADYPHVSNDRRDELVRWFRHEASALDIGTIASNAAIAEPYRRFRAEHIDPLKGKDIFRGLVFVAVVSAIVLMIIWRTL